MSFERDYKDLMAYAKLKVDFGKLQIFPEDLINDAYVNLYGQPYSVQLFRKEISNLSIKEKNNHTHIDQTYSVPEIKGDTTCVTCKQVKSANEFKVQIKYDGRRYLYTECIEYVNRKLMERYEGHKDTPEYKSRNKKNFKNFVDKDRKKWNASQKIRDKKERMNLADNYIKKILRSKKHTTEYILEHPELISQEREKIFQKRVAKLNKM